MKKFVTFLAFAINFSIASAQSSPAITAVSEAAKPLDAVAVTAAEENLLVKETEYNFGKIPQGKPVTHIFEVVNTGKTAFKIGNVVASCGCTTPVWEKDKILAAGETTKITVGYNAAAEGSFTKQITITYNESQVKVITIKGEVWKTPNASAPENNAANDLKN
ncbi:MAG: DUF1573 domain-containing protein [Chitinophagaceae bacterium]|nr:DUF1573 domain-containing protein [Chitinophagaceae bacterium]